MEQFKRKHIPVESAANEIGVTKAHIYRLIREGHLKAIDISTSGQGGQNSIRIESESVQVFIKLRQIDPNKKYFS